MPTFKNRITFELLHRVRAFLTIEAGISRNGAPQHQGPASPRDVGAATSPDPATQQVEQPGLRAMGRGNAGSCEALATNNPRIGDINPGNIVWIFGTARTGSTWLVSMMGEMAEYRWWREPLVGSLFGNFYDRSISANFKRSHFIFSDATRSAWLDGVRFFVLNAIRTHFPEKDGYVIVAEPNGSIGAPLLMEALPESRMIFLMRDPRDVVASALDRHREGGDAYKIKVQDPRKAGASASNPADHDPDGFVRIQAQRYVRNMSSAKQAFYGHQGRKVLVKYEDLRANTLRTMRQLYSALEIPVDERKLAAVVEKHSWENIPPEQKGPGKSNRKATPGGWREDLTPEQARIVERVTALFLEEFYID